MNRLLKCLPRYPVSYQRDWLYKIPHKVRDVVKLHSATDQPYVLIDRNRIDLPLKTYIANVRAPKVDNFLKFYDCQFNTFYNSTPVSRVLRQSFFLQIQNDIYFVMNQETFINQPQSPLYDQTTASSVLEPILSSTLKELRPSPAVPRAALINTVIKNVMERSFQNKLQHKMYIQLLKIVEQKIVEIELEIHEAEHKLALKAKKRVRWFTTFLMAEIALLHYFIYFNLSWDIMEPITVIITNIDIMVAYWFFILKGKNFSPQSWHTEIFSTHQHKHLINSGIDVPKYEEYLQIREYMRNRLKFMARNPSTFLQACQAPIQLLNNQ